jgi:hypothetical protein
VRLWSVLCLMRIGCDFGRLCWVAVSVMIETLMLQGFGRLEK